VTARAAPQLLVDLVVELADHETSHVAMISRWRAMAALLVVQPRAE